MLRERLYLCKNARVVLEMNLASEIGLANGSTGIIKEIVYEESQKAPELPKFCWVEMDDYSGPTFFKDNDNRRQWVPIYPKTANDSVYVKGEFKNISRTMLPIRLAWAWTIWKAQGQTYKGKIIIKLGSTERTHGLTYVAFSRSQRLSDIAITGGVYIDRLTKAISKKPSLQARLREDDRLRGLAESTKTQFHDIEAKKASFGTNDRAFADWMMRPIRLTRVANY